MFDITSVNVSHGGHKQGCHSYILLGGPAGKEVVGPTSPLGPEGATYILALAGLGYMKLIDVGSQVQGPGDYSVQVSGSPTNWFYRGEGQAKITVDAASCKYTISGGVNTIQGTLTRF